MPDAPAQDLAAERAVLGAMLVSPQAIDTAAELLQPDDFYRSAHGRVFRTAVLLHRRGEAADMLTVRAELLRRDELDVIGGDSVLASLYESGSSAANVAAYARIIASKRQVRDVRALAESFLSGINGELPDNALGLLSELAQVAEPKADGGEEHLTDDWQRVCSVDGSPRLPMPLAAFDGWDIRGGDLAFIGARPGSGKTAMLCNMAVHAARNGWRVLFLSAEMPSRPIKQRLLANALAADLAEIMQPRRDLAVEIAALENLPLHIVDARQGRLSLEDCIARIGRFARSADLRPAVVFVDYVQFIRPRARFDRRHELIEHTCREFKRAAVSGMLPLVVAAQVSRNAENRGKETIPAMSDLKASGAIEESGDHVALWHMETSANRSSPVALAVWKQRQGPQLVRDIFFDGPRVAFEDRDWQ